ncbi:MAG: hypothetical protein F4162_05225 [Synechococcus sp. SB0676_bin_10]|uniref:Transposase family protein n=1 Tax=Synechococcus sp. SB0676_bin_10 TaxID=2604869 RepID=A0A6B1F9H3_9SYNE|nr:hypothetical protein [Cyanobacteria bacterium MAG IRC3_bin_20]MYG38386.1 hypothetical protein [Synechococcus sp. SB0676_bin_10]MYK06407.1 hypothetical protein [Synechococcus sp. SB0670_bin_20]MYK84838.1 hypothetical protein [Synechococcus sp. SB0669_bin_7]
MSSGTPHLLPSNRQCRRGGKLSLGETLLILVLFPISAYKDFKHCWHYGLRHEYRDCFGALPRYGRFVSLPPHLLLPCTCCSITAAARDRHLLCRGHQAGPL